MKIRLKSKMNRIGFIILLSVITSSAFGQQHLWSTDKNDSISERYVPLNEVTNEVLKFYDVYALYYDLAGYSKEEFIKENGDDLKDWEWLNEINEITVFAIRANSENGSFVMIMCVSKNNVNMIVFSNTIDGSYQMTAESDKEKFVRWFKTLLN